MNKQGLGIIFVLIIIVIIAIAIIGYIAISYDLISFSKSKSDSQITDSASENPNINCVEEWTCTDYSPTICPKSGIKTRKCTDMNDCGTKDKMPETKISCEYEETTSKDINTDPCKEVFCSYGEKCVSGKCILKSCSELNGIICQPGQICIDGQFRKTSDTQYCCEQIGASNLRCESIISCSISNDCDDSNSVTYDYCYNSKCKYIPEQPDEFNLDSSKNFAIGRMEEDCQGNEITLAAGWEEKNNAAVRPCAIFEVWGWCKDWVLSCDINGSLYKYQSVIYKTPIKQEYKFAGGAAVP